MAADAKVPSYFQTTDGQQFGLSTSRWDERHRRSRLVLPQRATCWQYEPLVDMVRPAPGSSGFRFVGKSAQLWLDQLKRSCPSDYGRALLWYEALMSTALSHLDRRPRTPDNHYCVPLDTPPIRSLLAEVLSGLQLRRASAGQWLATLNGLGAKGIKAEEIHHSGLLVHLTSQPSTNVLGLDDMLAHIDIDHVMPRMVCESTYGFSTNAGWHQCCQRIPAPRLPRGSRKRAPPDLLREDLGILRYRHRAFGWGLFREAWRADLVSPRRYVWRIVDDKRKPVHPVKSQGFSDSQTAMNAAEPEIAARYWKLGKHNARPSWSRYTIAGANDYREILIQLDSWPDTYVSDHYRTRNVLVHVRTSIRHTSCGQKILFLDEVQSDWHADLYAQTKTGGSDQAQVAAAPFAKEWPLQSLKLMLWWAQKIGVARLAWSTFELQKIIWPANDPPELLYRKLLPDAARELAKTLGIQLETVAILFRGSGRSVRLSPNGWIVTNTQDPRGAVYKTLPDTSGSRVLRRPHCKAVAL